MYQAPNAPLSMGGVLDSGFTLFRECFTQVFLFAFATSLITAPASYLAPVIQTNGFSPSLIGGLIGGGFVLTIVTLILTSAIIVRVDAVAHGEQMSAADALARGARRAPSAFVSSLLMGIAIAAVPCLFAAAGLVSGVALEIVAALAALLIFVPGSVIAIWLIFGPYAAIVDRLGPFTSLRYSRAITRGHWWRTMALITIIAIILIVIYMVIAIAASVAAIGNPEAIAAGQSPWWLQFVVSPVLSAVAVPLSYSLFMAIFYDLKLRYEGGDLAARIAGTA
jgi:hypothetical protein